MPRRRAPETLADYMVVGISPALVMFLVGSLLWFLTIVFYQGDYTWRLLMVHGFFIMGVVATTRIAMEEGTAYASLFAFPLAAVVAFACISFVKVEGPLSPISPLINLALEGIIWFSAHKLTWDCTLIDDTQDSSKEGLLQAMGWDQVEGEVAPPGANGREPAPSSQPSDVDATTSREVQVFHWLQSFFVPDKRPHTPGVWIVYFALAALPLFGIGQWFIPSDQVELRRHAFWLLVVYVACSLGLLMNTSFLGLRRYLRQRNLLMPAEMAATWLGVGVTLIVAVLLIVWLFPRPSAEYSIAQIEAFKSKPLDPSKWGWGKDGTKKRSGERSTKSSRGKYGQESDKSKSGKSNSKGETSGKGKGSQKGDGEGAKGQDSKSGKSGGEKSSGGKGTGKDKSSDGSKSQESGSDSQKGDSKSGEKSGKKSQSSEGDKQKALDKEGQQKGDEQSNQSQSSEERSQDQSAENKSSESSSGDPESQKEQDAENSEDASNSESSESSESHLEMPQWLSNLSPTLAQIIRWVFYALVLITLLVLAWVYRAQLITAMQKLLAELRDLWARWFGGRQPTAAPEAAVPATRPRAFATYVDPFSSGMTGRATLAEVVRYTFEALEAWGREHQAPRATGQTAHEFAQQVGQVHEPLAGDVRFLAELYGQLAYAGGAVRQANLEPLKSLWQRMRLAT